MSINHAAIAEEIQAVGDASIITAEAAASMPTHEANFVPSHDPSFDGPAAPAPTMGAKL